MLLQYNNMQDVLKFFFQTCFFLLCSTYALSLLISVSFMYISPWLVTIFCFVLFRSLDIVFVKLLQYKLPCFAEVCHARFALAEYLAPKTPFEVGELLIVIPVECGILHQCLSLLGRAEMIIFLTKIMLQNRENLTAF